MCRQCRHWFGYRYRDEMTTHVDELTLWCPAGAVAGPEAGAGAQQVVPFWVRQSTCAHRLRHRDKRNTNNNNNNCLLVFALNIWYFFIFDSAFVTICYLSLLLCLTLLHIDALQIPCNRIQFVSLQFIETTTIKTKTATAATTIIIIIIIINTWTF